MNNNKKYPVLCAWCLKKGIKTITNYSEIENSHSCCDGCQREQFAELEKFNKEIKQ